MKFLRDIVEWFASLESGESFQKWIQIILKVFGVGVFILALVWSIVLIISVIANVDNTSSLLFPLGGSIILALFTIVVASVIIMLIWNRCNQINTLQNESDYTILNIAVILIRLSGVVVFIRMVATRVHGLIAGLFGIEVPGMVDMFFFPVDIGISFDWTFGLISIIVSIIYGIIIIISSYSIAALLNLVVGMGKDLKNVDAILSTEQPTSDS